MLQPVTTFARHESGGLAVWVNGKPVAVIKRDDLPALLVQAAQILRYPD